jgi:hypothetical protein
MVAEQQMRSQLKRTNYFVNTVIGLGIVGKLVGDSMAVLEVTGVAQRKNQASCQLHSSMVETVVSTPYTNLLSTGTRSLSKEEVKILPWLMYRLDTSFFFIVATHVSLGGESKRK